MSLLAKYKASLEVTGTTQVSAWGNSGGSGLDTSVYLTNYPETASVDINSTGNIKTVVQSHDAISTASLLETSDNLSDVTAWPGATIFVVGSQKVGAHLSDANAPFLQSAHFFVGRGTGNTIAAKFGFSTPTTLSIAANNNQFYIIALRANGVNQYLSINNGSQQTSGDVTHNPYTGGLELFGLDSCKGILEVQIWDEYLSGSAFTTEYNALYNEYLAAPTTTVLTFPALATKTVGDANFAPGATSNSPATITYTSSNTSVATIVSGNIHIVGAGTSTITAIQGAATGYTDPADVTRTLTVNPLNTMANINGKDVVLKFSTDGGTTKKLLVCETESGFSAKTDTTSSQTKCDGGTTIVALGSKSWSMSGSGVIKTSPGSGEVSYGDLLAWWSAGTALTAYIDETSSAFKHEGAVWITSLDLKLPVDGAANFSIELTGNGTLTIA